MPTVQQVAEDKRRKGEARHEFDPVPTWPPLEPLKGYYIHGLRLSLKERFLVLAIRMRKKPVEMINLIIEAGCDALEAEQQHDEK